MWAQQWSNIYPLVEPYPGVGSLDVTAALKARRDGEYKRLLSEFKGKPTPLDLAELESGQKALRRDAVSVDAVLGGLDAVGVMQVESAPGGLSISE